MKRDVEACASQQVTTVDFLGDYVINDISEINFISIFKTYRQSILIFKKYILCISIHMHKVDSD